MFKLLYRTGKTEKEFSKLEWVDKSGKENDEISPFFQKCIKNIFPELIFIFKENRKETTRYKFSKGRELDAICWYPKGQFFIIFEYKSEKPRKIVDQIFEYLEVFSDEDNKDCRNLFKDLNNSLSGSESASWESIKWEGLKLVWISPGFPSQNQNSKYFEISSVIWVKSEWYEGSDEIAVRLDSEDKENLLEQLSKKGKIKTPKPERENLLQLLQEIKFSKKEVEKWVEKINKKVVEEFLLNPKFRYYPEYNWGEGVGIIEYRKDKKLFFWVRIVKSSLKIFFNIRAEEILLPLTKKYEPFFQFKSYWNIKVKDENSFQQALLILEEFLAKVKDKNE